MSLTEEIKPNVIEVKPVWTDLQKKVVRRAVIGEFRYLPYAAIFGILAGILIVILTRGK